MTKMNDFFNGRKIRKSIVLKESETIWWKFEPFRFLSKYPFNDSKQIYHVVDPYMHFWQSNYQAQNSDLIVCTSPKYLSFFQEKSNSKTLHIPHGISDDEFKLDTSRIEQLKNEYGDYAIFIGTVGNDIDIELIKKIIDRSIKILIIGSENNTSKEWAELRSSNLLCCLGIMHAKELKHFIAASKVGLVTYNSISNRKNQVSRSPLKALNYLAQCKATITTIDSEISELEGKGVFLAKDHGDYLNLVVKAMNDQLPIDQAKINNYLTKHRYPNLIESILNQLDNA